MLILCSVMAVTGAFDAIEFRGIDEMSLFEKWNEGPKTYLGITVQHFPNMFMAMGPHQAYGNIPRSVEFAVGWISDCIEYLHSHNLTYIEAKEEEVSPSVYPNLSLTLGADCLQVKAWTEHVHKISEGFLSNDVDSWMTGVNRNVAGKQKRIVARYNGAAPEFRRRCLGVKDAEYNTFTLV